jgi:hypothetical protein
MQSHGRFIPIERERISMSRIRDDARPDVHPVGAGLDMVRKRSTPYLKSVKGRSHLMESTHSGRLTGAVPEGKLR